MNKKLTPEEHAALLKSMDVAHMVACTISGATSVQNALQAAAPLAEEIPVKQVEQPTEEEEEEEEEATPLFVPEEPVLAAVPGDKKEKKPRKLQRNLLELVPTRYLLLAPSADELKNRRDTDDFRKATAIIQELLSALKTSDEALVCDVLRSAKVRNIPAAVARTVLWSLHNDGVVTQIWMPGWVSKHMAYFLLCGPQYANIKKPLAEKWGEFWRTEHPRRHAALVNALRQRFMQPRLRAVS